MLDLRNTDYWNIQLPDGQILDIKMPTVRRDEEVNAVISLLNTEQSVPVKEAHLYELLKTIFNDNVNDRVFNVDDIKNIIQSKHIFMILDDYIAYTNKLKKK